MQRELPIDIRPNRHIRQRRFRSSKIPLVKVEQKGTQFLFDKREPL